MPTAYKSNADLYLSNRQVISDYHMGRHICSVIYQMYN